MTIDEATETVKRAVRLQAVHLCWPMPGIMDKIREQEAAKKALAEVPVNAIASHPFYPSTDEGQCGCILAAHLTDEQMLGVPLHIVDEVLDEIGSSAEGVNHTSLRESQRGQLLKAYGPAFAELVCDAIDEALASRRQAHARLTDWDGKKHAPLDSTEIDEPRYDFCDADAEHASPITSFDFWNAIEAARELVDARDKAAAAARRGDAPPTPEAIAA